MKVRQVSSQIILDGQVPDSKMMADILQVVQTVVRMSGGIRMTGGGGGGGGRGRGRWDGRCLGRRDGRWHRRHGWAGGMMGGAAGGLVIINRVVVPGPRQVLLHVKIAELNRTAIRTLGISWLDTKGQIDHRLPIGSVGTVERYLRRRRTA